MRIVLATPLYPPDIAEPAPYVKELARRLAKNHKVTVVTYGRLPEQVTEVNIVAVDKRQTLAVRLVRYFFALLKAARAADIVYAQNGPSVELPLIAVSLVCRTPLVMRAGDEAAHAYAGKHFMRHIVERIAFAHAKKIITDSPLPRPEILPFEPRPEQALAGYEASWETHVRMLEKIFDGK